MTSSADMTWKRGLQRGESRSKGRERERRKGSGSNGRVGKGYDQGAIKTQEAKKQQWRMEELEG